MTSTPSAANDSGGRPRARHCPALCLFAFVVPAWALNWIAMKVAVPPGKRAVISFEPA